MNDTEFQKIWEPLGPFSEFEVQLFNHRLVKKKISKDQVLQWPGEIPQSVFFILKGSFYQFHTCPVSDEKRIIDLHMQDEWFCDTANLLKQLPSKSATACFSDAEIAELSLESMHELIGLSPRFLQLNSIFGRLNSRLEMYDENMNPAQKYNHLLTSRPQLLQAFPLSMIASYLKMRPETLSRVRADVII